MIDVDELAQEIRRVDGNHDKGAGALAEALMPFLERAAASRAGVVKPLEWHKGYCDERVTIHQASNGWLYQVRVLDGVIWLDWPDKEATQFPSEERAREAAFADYSARIMSAIEPAGVGVETGGLWISRERLRQKIEASPDDFECEVRPALKGDEQ